MPTRRRQLRGREITQLGTEGEGDANQEMPAVRRKIAWLKMGEVELELPGRRSWTLFY